VKFDRQECRGRGQSEFAWFMIDRATGEDITPAGLRRADDETGEYEVTLRGEDGRARLVGCEPHEVDFPVVDPKSGERTTRRVPCSVKAAAEVRKGDFDLVYRPLAGSGGLCP
jgi:hypothetical protein